MDIKFKKSSAVITCKRGKVIYPEEVTGWGISVGGLDFVFHHNPNIPKIWHATEVETGAYVTRGKTRKECAEWVVENIDRIVTRKAERLDEINRLIEEGLQ